MPAPANGPPIATEHSAPTELTVEKALLPSPSMGVGESLIDPDSPAIRLPVELDVAVAVRDFRVRNLLALEPGQVIETQWGHGQDVPLASGAVQLAWSEFEVVDSQLAVRLTRLA